MDAHHGLEESLETKKIKINLQFFFQMYTAVLSNVVGYMYIEVLLS